MSKTKSWLLYRILSLAVKLISKNWMVLLATRKQSGCKSNMMMQRNNSIVILIVIPASKTHFVKKCQLSWRKILGLLWSWSRCTLRAWVWTMQLLTVKNSHQRRGVTIIARNSCVRSTITSSRPSSTVSVSWRVSSTKSASLKTTICAEWDTLLLINIFSDQILSNS